ncbi:MAG: DevR family CRISPR-associated autoregulator [Thermofilaceae archaeon]
MVFASLSVRMRVDVEALNMVEALGAYGRHRTASILKPRPDGRGYRLIIAPAVSGQALAFGYMKTLVALAQMKNLPVCDECREYEIRGGFLKHATSEDKTLSEWKLVEQCIVEDLTGFLVPEVTIRRTSPLSFSYMLPDIESANVALDPQFHVRAPMPGQQPRPFQVEAGTAVYTVSVFIDVGRIGMGYEKVQGGISLKALDGEKKGERIRVAYEALGCLFEGLTFGAKKARYLPIYEIVGAVAALSKPLPFMVSPARLSKNRNYIEDTISRAERYVSLLKDTNEEVTIFYFDKEGVYTPSGASPANPSVTAVGTFSELIEKLRDKTLEWIKAGSGK